MDRQNVPVWHIDHPETALAEIRTARRWPDPEDGPWAVSLDWRRRAAMYRCEGIYVGWAAVIPHWFSGLGPMPDEVSGALMRSLPVGQLIREAHAAIVADHADDLTTRSSFTREEALAAIQDAQIKPRRGRVPTYDAEFLGRVAQVYINAVSARQPPTRAVADSRELGGPRSKSAAAKLVARARRLGLLAPTSRGRVGQVIPDVTQEEASGE